MTREHSDSAASTFDPGDLLRRLTTCPGVYRMLDDANNVLYVGKAHNLKSRVSSYFRQERNALPLRIRSMVEQVRDVQVTITRTAADALLLESNLIKQLKPRYNIYLRDDKSYPYIYFSNDTDFPRLAFDRGKRQGDGRYFGPYPSAAAVRETLNQLQKVFRVRQCEDSFFRNRSRPCLQYQIKRCTAPCVGLINSADYWQDVDNALLFLQGKSSTVIQRLVTHMEQAATDLKYEAAANYRDQVQLLRRIHDQQQITAVDRDMDIIAGIVEHGIACVQVFYIRAGRNLGGNAFFPTTPAGASTTDVVYAFIAQYYLTHEIPDELLINQRIEEHELLTTLLTEQAGRKIRIISQPRGERSSWVQLALTNAQNALMLKLSSRQTLASQLEDLQLLLELDVMPERIECFDISHTQGEATVASCVVFDRAGPVKSDYRRFNIKAVTAGDDYAAMQQALERRYTRLKQEDGKLPDLILIDGGQGQVNIALEVLQELQLDPVVVGVAKGPDRIVGQERLLVPHLDKELRPRADRAALHLLQKVRDEAHRFAIAGHRARRQKARHSSPLDGIVGLGPKRRQALLKGFGGMQGLKNATVEDLATVQGISMNMARRIYDILH